MAAAQCLRRHAAAGQQLPFATWPELVGEADSVAASIGDVTIVEVVQMEGQREEVAAVRMPLSLPRRISELAKTSP